MDSKSLAHDGRSRFVGPAFCRELSELTGIELAVLNSAFAGERVNTALDVVKTVVAENLDKTPEDWTQILRGRAKAEGLGEYRSGYWDGYELTWEHNEHLRRIGRLGWAGPPEPFPHEQAETAAHPAARTIRPK